MIQAKELLQASLLDEGAYVPVVPASGDGMLHTRQWDCESVLSMQTNLDNHPSLLGEPSSSRYQYCRTTITQSPLVRLKMYL